MIVCCRCCMPILGAGQQQLYLLLGRRASRSGEEREDGQTVDVIWSAKKPHMLQLHCAFFHDLHPHNVYNVSGR